MEPRQSRAHIESTVEATSKGSEARNVVVSGMFILPMSFILVITAWMTIALIVRHQQTRRQQEIVHRGACCEGRVVAIQRPFMLETCTRVYFDFEPPGVDRPLRVCHIDRRPAAESAAPLLHTGTPVAIHYLPEHPREAVISKLV